MISENKRGYVLCISVSHNSSAALMQDGRLLVAAQEERFERVKNYYGYPFKSIDYCLSKAGVSGKQLDSFAYTTKTFPGLEVKAKRTVNFSLADWHDYFGDKYYIPKFSGDIEKVLAYKRYLRDDPKFNSSTEYFNFDYLKDEKYLIDDSLDAHRFQIEQAEQLSRHISIDSGRVEFLDHHSCHAYYAYFGSPFRGQPCIIITLDGWGDGRNQTVWRVINDVPNLIAESDGNDIGRIYKLATLLLAMKPDEHEFKVMGLSPYAKEQYVEKAMSIIKDISEIVGMRIVAKSRPKNLYSFLNEGWRTSRFDSIAGAVQLYAEKLVKELVSNIISETGIRKFVISGGISMNIKINKTISEMEGVEALYVCASGGDESLSIGGCYLLSEQKLKIVTAPITTMCLGFDIADEFYLHNFEIYKDHFDVNDSVSHDDIARLLERGDIVGVIRGKAEFGARALGNRSIIANPSLLESVQRINEAIKNRDFWMPFALSIMEEYGGEFLENPKAISSPFMTIGFDTKAEKYSKIVAGTHPYDKSVRPQMVSQKTSPEWHSLLSAFHKITGIPALLNTSFNLHGEPIVNNIEDAIKTFSVSGLDHLLIQDKIIISKREKTINIRV
jgi:carbamoyltransferase